MGISPWYWFADVPVKKTNHLYVTAGVDADAPAVKYRGIFINDEDPAFSSWARHQFGGVNAKAYAPIFELLLRLKANYLWPAMWGKSFHSDDPKSTKLADDMGIVMGTSHHEPMMRAHKEWHTFTQNTHKDARWNYNTHKRALQQFWREGIERMTAKGEGGAFDSLVTIGMRGDGDEPMAEGTAISLLETIVDDQRQIIEQVTAKPAQETPQVWALYKEVQDYYDKGMQVPDDVTLLFADDNWGQIRRLPTTDHERSGGYGVYYHFDYVGAPRSYKWLNTVQIEKTWQQMDLAYERGARALWVVNVGDLKPMEYPIDFFLRMAWRPEALTPTALSEFPKQWAERIFGEPLSGSIAKVMTRYSQLAAKVKPEFLNEDYYPIGEATKTHLIPGEFYQVANNWQQLEAKMMKIKQGLKSNQLHAFYQLIEFPILAMNNLHELYFSAAWNRRLARHYDYRANHFLRRAEQAYEKDGELTKEFHSFNGGKWQGMMSQVHMNYTIWHAPIRQTPPSLAAIKGAPKNDRHHFINMREPQPFVQLDLTQYKSSKPVNGLAWQVIKHLGQGSAGLIGYPQGREDRSKTHAPTIAYGISINDTGNLEVQLGLSPTLNTVNDEPLLLGVSLNNGPMKTVSIQLQPTAGGAANQAQEDWVRAVSDNVLHRKVSFGPVASGQHTLKLWRLSDNVIVQSLSYRQ